MQFLDPFNLLLNSEERKAPRHETNYSLNPIPC
jgi:hypothetical protein